MATENLFGNFGKSFELFIPLQNVPVIGCKNQTEIQFLHYLLFSLVFRLEHFTRRKSSSRCKILERYADIS